MIRLFLFRNSNQKPVNEQMDLIMSSNSDLRLVCSPVGLFVLSKWDYAVFQNKEKEVRSKYFSLNQK